VALTFYDSRGIPVAYTSDDEHIYTFTGKPVAYLHQGSVYSYAGRHLGRFINGWIRDNRGDAVFYTNVARGGPLKPLKKIKPIKSVRQLRPLKAIRQLRPIRPLNSLSWSGLSGRPFFEA
jgi:4-fold beta-flower domain-containing protein